MTDPPEKKPRMLPPAYLLAAVLLMIGLNRFLPGAQIIHSPLRYGGLLVLAIALPLVLWAAGLFRRVGTTIRPFQESSALVVEGPYRATRNPMYLGMVGILLGTGMLLGSLSPFVVVPAFAALIEARFIRAEEAALQAAFGSAYSDYRARVRRWL